MDKKSLTTGSLGALGILVAAALVLAATPDPARGDRSVPGLAAERQYDSHDEADLERADPVDRQLAAYARKVPELGFLRLYGKHAMQVVAMLPTMLGKGAFNVDYEHEASLRETLVELQQQRIARMVQDGLPSATLFKLGNGSSFKHGYLCVITLDTAPYRQDPAYASRLMLPASLDGPLADAGAPLVRNEDFLRFTADHEAFHCLDAYFNGPTIRKTREPIADIYQDFVNEARADAFASRSFTSSRGAADGFLARFAALRTLAVLDMDLTHTTGEIIERAAALPGAAPGIEQRVAASRSLVETLAPSPDRFAIRIASAQRLLERQGRVPGDELPVIEGLSLHRPNAATMASLEDSLRQARTLLATEASANASYAQSDNLETRRVALGR